MKRRMATWPDYRQHFGGVHWRWVLPLGLLIPIVAVASWAALVLLYGVSLAVGVHGPPDTGRIGEFGRQGSWAVPVLVLALTAVAASWVARRAGGSILAQGALLGATSAIVGLIVWSLFHGRPAAWIWLAVALTVGAGWLGGKEAQASAAGQEALYRASRAVGAAQDPGTLVTAIGEHLADQRVERIALWQIVARDAAGPPTDLALLATWSSPGRADWPPDLRLAASQVPLLARLRPDAPLTFALGDLPPAERPQWERLGVRSAVLVPLVTGVGRWRWLILVASPIADGVGGAMGGYLAIGAQAATVLENLRLIEQGRHLGALSERQRLAREIHDSVKQQVFATEMQIAAALALIERDPVGAQARLIEADALVRRVQEELAVVIHELRPATLDGRGLAEVLRDYVAGWSRQSDIAAEVSVVGDAPLPLEVEQALLRIAQEALANVARHSAATSATVALTCADGVATLRVGDNGSGFDPDARGGQGYGLLSMSERITALGGRLSVASAPGRGTRVTCTCPLVDRRGGGLDTTWST